MQITGCITTANNKKNENKITKVKFSSDHTVASLTGVVNLKGKDTYIITFTTDNASLGPITIYVDKNSYKVLGADLRD